MPKSESCTRRALDTTRIHLRQGRIPSDLSNGTSSSVQWDACKRQFNYALQTFGWQPDMGKSTQAQNSRSCAEHETLLWRSLSLEDAVDGRHLVTQPSETQPLGDQEADSEAAAALDMRLKRPTRQIAAKKIEGGKGKRGYRDGAAPPSMDEFGTKTLTETCSTSRISVKGDRVIESVAKRKGATCPASGMSTRKTANQTLETHAMTS